MNPFNKEDDIEIVLGQPISLRLIAAILLGRYPESEPGDLYIAIRKGIDSTIRYDASRLQHPEKEPIRNVQAFIIHISIRRISRIIKSRQNKIETCELNEEEHEDDTDLFIQAIMWEQTHIIASAIARLPDLTGNAIILFYWYGCSHQQIAEILKISVDVAKARCHRGRQALRIALADYCAEYIREVDKDIEGDQRLAS